ncbi:DUF5018-related domain-containing protein [Dyadobacter bucti]|uniref:DUF5018-related domain-containing protein n=1 Tax=Dyadobacter bucti TaxID=2572203 RepID=UPI003F7108ED
MKTFNKITLCVLGSLSFLLSSCLKKDLPVLPLWDGNEITLVNIEHRFNGTGVINGQPVVAYQKLVAANQIDVQNATINLQVSVPDPSGQFTAKEKAKVSQSRLWVYMNISTAATIAPVEGTAKPGDAADLTKPLKYEVTAANGSKRTWTVNVTTFKP